MGRTRELVAVVGGGTTWSVTFLVVMTIIDQRLGAATAVALMWPIKIAWSILHTAYSRWRGKAAATCATCAEGV